MPPGRESLFHLITFLNPVHAAEVILPRPVVSHPDLHLNHIVDGIARFEFESEAYDVEAGTAVFIPPYTAHRCYKFKDTPLEMLNCHFHLNTPEGRSIIESKSLPRVFEPTDFSAIHHDLHAWFNQWEREELGGCLMVSACLHQLIARYFDNYGTPVEVPPNHDERMEMLRNELVRTVAEPYEAWRFAESVSLSVSQMNRRFSQAFGVSPKQYWQTIRMGEIQSALRYGSENLSEIARMFGFQDLYYFSKWFKKKQGISPSAFRKASREVAL